MKHERDRWISATFDASVGNDAEINMHFPSFVRYHIHETYRWTNRQPENTAAGVNSAQNLYSVFPQLVGLKLLPVITTAHSLKWISR